MKKPRTILEMPEGDHMTMGEYQTLGGAASTRENLTTPTDAELDALIAYARSMPEGWSLHKYADAITTLREQVAVAEGRAGWLAQFVIDKFNGTPDLDGWVRRSAMCYDELLRECDRISGLHADAMRLVEKAEADNAALLKENKLMHMAICDAVTHLTTGYPHDASIVLRTELVRVADAALLAGKESVK